MFRRLPEIGASDLVLSVDGREVAGRNGDSVAACLLAAGILQCRTTPVSGAPRAPWCLMGVCFECLVEIDGVGNRQACMVRARQGMQVVTGQGRREVGR